VVPKGGRGSRPSPEGKSSVPVLAKGHGDKGGERKPAHTTGEPTSLQGIGIVCKRKDSKREKISTRWARTAPSF